MRGEQLQKHSLQNGYDQSTQLLTSQRTGKRSLAGLVQYPGFTNDNEDHL